MITAGLVVVAIAIWVLASSIESTGNKIAQALRDGKKDRP